MTDFIFRGTVSEPLVAKPGDMGRLHLPDGAREVVVKAIAGHRGVSFIELTVVPPPGMDGPPCVYCGGMTRQAGTCYVCNSCGETTGCA